MAKPSKTNVQFDVIPVAIACNKAPTYFSVVPQATEKGVPPKTFKVFDANRDALYEGSYNQVTTWLEGARTGCQIGTGKVARQTTLMGGVTRAPKPPKVVVEKPVPKGQQRLY